MNTKKKVFATVVDPFREQIKTYKLDLKALSQIKTDSQGNIILNGVDMNNNPNPSHSSGNVALDIDTNGCLTITQNDEVSSK